MIQSKRTILELENRLGPEYKAVYTTRHGQLDIIIRKKTSFLFFPLYKGVGVILEGNKSIYAFNKKEAKYFKSLGFEVTER